MVIYEKHAVYSPKKEEKEAWHEKNSLENFFCLGKQKEMKR
jgi:hypothetical protein